MVHNDGGIDAARNVSADLDVGHGLPLHRTRKGLVERLVVFGVAGEAQGLDRTGERPTPVALQPRRSPLPGQRVAGWDLLDLGEHGPLAHHSPEANRLDQRARIDRQRHFPVGEQSLDLGGEDEGLAIRPPEQRADAEGIPQEMDGACVAVPDGDRELAVQHAGHAGAVLLIEVQQDLDLGVGGKDMALGGEGCAQLAVIINLAIEDDGNRLVLVEDRLLAGCHIDDGQTPCPERYSRPLPEAGRIGPAVPQALGHALEGRSIVWPGEAGDPAHPVRL